MATVKMAREADGTGAKRKRRSFTPEYKAQVVQLCSQPGKTPNGVAKELGLTVSAVRTWVEQSRVDAGGGGVGALTTSEREELSKLRRENRQLRQERDILEKATAFFAKRGAS
jgi:transposase